MGVVDEYTLLNYMLINQGHACMSYSNKQRTSKAVRYPPFLVWYRTKWRQQKRVKVAIKLLLNQARALIGALLTTPMVAPSLRGGSQT